MLLNVCSRELRLIIKITIQERVFTLSKGYQGRLNYLENSCEITISCKFIVI